MLIMSVHIVKSISEAEDDFFALGIQDEVNLTFWTRLAAPCLIVSAAEVAEAASPEVALLAAAVGADLAAVAGGPATAAVLPSIVTPWLSPGKLQGKTSVRRYHTHAQYRDTVSPTGELNVCLTCNSAQKVY